MRIALCGPILAGKSTVARLLEGLYGYDYINFTRSLKEIAVGVVEPYRPGITVETIEKNKEKWRPFLQELGMAIEFDTNPGFITALMTTADDIVFDNVRTDAQWCTLQELGFHLVKIQLSRNDQDHLAERIGMDYYALQERMSHPIENSLNVSPWRTYDAGRSSAESIAKWIAAGGTEQPPAVRQHRGNFEQDMPQEVTMSNSGISSRSHNYATPDLLSRAFSSTPVLAGEYLTRLSEEAPPLRPIYRGRADARLERWVDGSFHVAIPGEPQQEVTREMATEMMRAGYVVHYRAPNMPTVERTRGTGSFDMRNDNPW